MTNINIKIDGKKTSVPQGYTIVEAAKTLNIVIPTLCHRDELKPFTSCFICVVEIKGQPKLVPACSTSVNDGMEIITDSPKIRETRKVCIELLISEHLGDCVSPCQMECPADCNIKGYLKAISEKDYMQAIAFINETIPLASSIGRVCPRPCESVCRRTKKDQAPPICSLKRFAGDRDLESADNYKPELKAATGKKVVIVGAGPAGLSAASYLAKQGHSVKIYEAHPKSGGYLQYGIPQYRLPKEVLDKEVKRVQDLGVEIQYNTRVGEGISKADIESESDAVLLAMGAQLSSSMWVDGEDSEGVVSGIEFLEKINSGLKCEIGNKVVVVGGGNTAIDCARTALRLGADVTMLYRRTKKEMPADDFEIEAAEEEGVKFEFLTAPVKIDTQKDNVIVECIKMQLGEPDSSGRRRPVKIKGSEYNIEVSKVISAIGQKVDADAVQKLGAQLSKWKTIKTNETTGGTEQANLFAAGECVTGPGIATAAIGRGRVVAIAVDQYLKGEEVVGEKIKFSATMGRFEDIPEEFYEDMKHAQKFEMPELPVKERVDNFEEVELGCSEDVARDIAAGCLQCGCIAANDCLLRDYATEYNAKPERWAGEQKEYFVDKSHPDLIFESNKCILCGCCVRYSYEIKNVPVMGFVNRGFETVIRPAFTKPLGNIEFDFPQELAEVCPTGAIALKP